MRIEYKLYYKELLSGFIIDNSHVQLTRLCHFITVVIFGILVITSM